VKIPMICVALFQWLVVFAGQALAAVPEEVGSAAEEGKSSSRGAGFGFLPIIIIFAIFYFLIIAPQRKTQKQTEKMQVGLKRGDKVITTSGMHGSIVDIKEGEKIVVVEIAPNVRVQLNRTAVSSLKNLSTSQPVAK